MAIFTGFILNKQFCQEIEFPHFMRWCAGELIFEGKNQASRIALRHRCLGSVAPIQSMAREDNSLHI